MRVLVLSEFYPHQKNSTEGIIVREQLLQLSRQCDIRVLVPAMRYLPLPRYRALRKDTASAGHFSADEIPITRFAVWNPPLIAELIAPEMHRRSVLAAWHEQGLAPDLIHAHWAYRSGFVAAKVMEKYECPLVVTVQGSDINYWLHESRKRKRIVFALQRADAIIAVSRALAERVAAEGIATTKIHHIPNGVDLQVFRVRPGLLRDELKTKFGDVPLFLCVANLFDLKGQDVLLRAMALLPEGAGAVVFVGDGTDRPRLEKLAGQLHIAERVYFAGRIRHSEVPAWMNACDALVIPSWNEGVPAVAFEALACGLPVVSTKVGILPEVITSDDFGVLVPVGDPPALAAALFTAARRTWDKGKLRTRAEAFSWERLSAQVLQVYRSLLGDGRK